MNPTVRKAGCALLFAACMAWTGLFLPQKITLATADIGRHLKNGESVLAGRTGVLSTNFYSYTHPDYPTLNHHWGSGVLFYGIHRVFGFEGLCVFQFLLLLAAWALMFALAVRRGGWGWAAVWALWLVPVFAARREIRPEAISVFFAACSIFIFERYENRRISGRAAGIALALLQLLWTNLHIYFVLGPLIAAVYAARTFLDPEGRRSGKFASLAGIFAAVSVVTFLNPFGVRGALYPFFIFGDYGYRLVENQSIPFLEKLNITLPAFSFFKAASIALASAAALETLTARRVPRAQTLLALLFAAAGWRAIRNFQMFALLALPALAGGFAAFTDFRGRPARLIRGAVMVLGTAAVLAATVQTFGGHPFKRIYNWGFGLSSSKTAAADFFKEEKLKGPIFNNYDIGGYLIYALWPDERVFVDNRPEAYPSSFFKDVLVPAQESDENWRALDAQYGFNVIFFNYRDYTPWGQAFLQRRFADPDWAPVFADDYSLIFLRRTVENAPVIVRREMPRSAFRVVESKDGA